MLSVFRIISIEPNCEFALATYGADEDRARSEPKHHWNFWNRRYARPKRHSCRRDASPRPMFAVGQVHGAAERTNVFRAALLNDQRNT